MLFKRIPSLTAGQPAERTRFTPGKNCWRVEHADRFALLIDGEAYFRSLREAIVHAERTVFIVGWDIDSRMQLEPGGAADGFPAGLGEFLQAVVAARPRLRVYVLAWDFAMLYAFEREWMPVFKADWRNRKRMSFLRDGRHPLGSSHHQKMVVIDDALAFVGGLDLTRSRWDTPAHASHAPDRRTVAAVAAPARRPGVDLVGLCGSRDLLNPDYLVDRRDRSIFRRAAGRDVCRHGQHVKRLDHLRHRLLVGAGRGAPVRRPTPESFKREAGAARFAGDGDSARDAGCPVHYCQFGRGRVADCIARLFSGHADRNGTWDSPDGGVCASTGARDPASQCALDERGRGRRCRADCLIRLIATAAGPQCRDPGRHARIGACRRYQSTI